MPQIGWFEILIIVSIAIVVVGPKDFPHMLKKIGSWIGSIKRYVSNVQDQVSNLENETINVEEEYRKLGTAPGYCHHCETGLCPVGVTTQLPDLEKRLQPDWGERRLRNYLQTLNMELTTLARACGKSNVHHLEREDLVALTVESAAMAKVPLAGTDWIPGSG